MKKNRATPGSALYDHNKSTRVSFYNCFTAIKFKSKTITEVSCCLRNSLTVSQSQLYFPRPSIAKMWISNSTFHVNIWWFSLRDGHIKFIEKDVSLILTSVETVKICQGPLILPHVKVSFVWTLVLVHWDLQHKQAI